MLCYRQSSLLGRLCKGVAPVRLKSSSKTSPSAPANPPLRETVPDHQSFFTTMLPSSWNAPERPYKDWELEPSQKAQLTATCILVDERDWVLGMSHKRECHLIQNGSLPLHRAFSLFVFNSRKELLVQQRSADKITFPGAYSNTVCSHPAYNYAEMEEKNQMGVKKAIVPRAKYELGIDLNLEDLKFITRIHYSHIEPELIWGEHEIDYIFIAQKDVIVQPEATEVQDYMWLPRERIEWFVERCASRGIPLTVWFKLMLESKDFLLKWWDNLDHVEDFADEKIHRLN